MRILLGIAVFTTLIAAGCTRSSDALRVNTQGPPQPLPSTPVGDLYSTELGPLDPNNPSPTDLNQPQASIQGFTEAASLEQRMQADEPINHDSISGAWNVNSDNPQCRVILSFTRWSGGYRAGARRCNAPELASVSAWDIKDNRVVLVNGNGEQVASLGFLGNEQYAGSLSDGNQITFSR